MEKVEKKHNRISVIYFLIIQNYEYFCNLSFQQKCRNIWYVWKDKNYIWIENLLDWRSRWHQWKDLMLVEWHSRWHQWTRVQASGMKLRFTSVNTTACPWNDVQDVLNEHDLKLVEWLSRYHQWTKPHARWMTLNMTPVNTTEKFWNYFQDVIKEYDFTLLE